MMKGLRLKHSIVPILCIRHAERPNTPHRLEISLLCVLHSFNPARLVTASLHRIAARLVGCKLSQLLQAPYSREARRRGSCECHSAAGQGLC